MPTMQFRSPISRRRAARSQPSSDVPSPATSAQISMVLRRTGCRRARGYRRSQILGKGAPQLGVSCTSASSTASLIRGRVGRRHGELVESVVGPFSTNESFELEVHGLSQSTSRLPDTGVSFLAGRVASSQPARPFVVVRATGGCRARCRCRRRRENAHRAFLQGLLGGRGHLQPGRGRRPSRHRSLGDRAGMHRRHRDGRVAARRRGHRPAHGHTARAHRHSRAG